MARSVDTNLCDRTVTLKDGRVTSCRLAGGGKCLKDTLGEQGERTILSTRRCHADVMREIIQALRDDEIPR